MEESLQVLLMALAEFLTLLMTIRSLLFIRVTGQMIHLLSGKIQKL